MRCIAFGEAWKEHCGNVFIISNCNTNSIIAKIKSNGFNFISLQDIYPDSADIQITLKTINEHSEGKSWVLIDGYDFDLEYQNCIKENGNNLLVIDDIAHLKNYSADIIVNQNINGNEFNYSCNNKTKLLLGSSYAIIRDDFMNYNMSSVREFSNPSNLLITLGGSDPYNFSKTLVTILNGFNDRKLNIKVIIGSLIDNTDINFNSSYHELNYIEILPSDMPELMEWADIAISSGGSTPWELTFMGLPALVICFAHNQINSMEYLHQYGSIINLGWYSDLTENKLLIEMENLLNDEFLRKKMSEKGTNLIDGSGRKRIIDNMNSYN